MDLDNYSATDVDKLNVLALEYGIAASSFSKLVSLHFFISYSNSEQKYIPSKMLHLYFHSDCCKMTYS